MQLESLTALKFSHVVFMLSRYWFIPDPNYFKSTLLALLFGIRNSLSDSVASVISFVFFRTTFTRIKLYRFISAE